MFSIEEENETHNNNYKKHEQSQGYFINQRYVFVQECSFL